MSHQQIGKGPPFEGNGKKGFNGKFDGSKGFDASTFFEKKGFESATIGVGGGAIGESRFESAGKQAKGYE